MIFYLQENNPASMMIGKQDKAAAHPTVNAQLSYDRVIDS